MAAAVVVDRVAGGAHEEPAEGNMPAPPMDLSHHWSRATKSRGFSQMKAFYKFFLIPGIGQLAGGLPNVQYFPFDTLEAQVAKPDRWTPTPNNPDAALSSASAPSKPAAASASRDLTTLHATVPKVTPIVDPASKIDLSSALQYGLAGGYPPLRSFVRQFTRDHLHPSVPYLGGPEVILTCGSTDGFAKTVELIVDPWDPVRDAAEDRPHMLCEVFVYPSVLSQTRPKGVRPVPVEMDGEGMSVDGPGGLRDVLENWDPKNGRRPHFMYTVSMGHNPTGFVVPLSRRKEIYSLCSEFDVIIVEDDPYWYLQFPSAGPEEARSRGLPLPPPAEKKDAPVRSSGYEFLDSMEPSYLSIDTDGRVIRLDTFSKTVAPGCRLGWITCQPKFCERFERITETSTQQPSGFVQSIIAETIMGQQPPAATSTFLSLSSRERHSFSGWKMDGWVRWLSGLRGSYERRMATMCAILDDGAHQLKQSTPARDADADWGVVTKTRLVSFDWPRGGMFIWMRVHFEHHPLWQARGGERVPLLDGPALATALLIFFTHKPFLVLPAPGTTFAADEEVATERAWQYYRVCFAAESDDKIKPCAENMMAAVHKFWRIKDPKRMEELVLEFTGDGDQKDVDALADDVSNLGFPIGC